MQASREIKGFCNTMETLYAALKSANLAFYAGDLEIAYAMLEDALRLFVRLGNKKAIGIASNNLGNVMLAMYQEIKGDEGFGNLGLKKKDVITRGIAYYHKAITLGEEAYDEYFNVQGWNPKCLDFMQHLANRYFNRGVFLLTIKNDHSNPVDLEELGMRDLKIASDMDQEVLSYAEEGSVALSAKVEQMFNTNLARVKGHNLLIEKGYPDKWETKEILDETFEMISRESRKPKSDLFGRITVTGRLQEVEAELMKYFVSTGNLQLGAEIAIRMLIEDEIVFLLPQVQAIDTLLVYIKSPLFTHSHVESLIEYLEDHTSNLREYLSQQNDKSMRSLHLENAESFKHSAAFALLEKRKSLSIGTRTTSSNRSNPSRVSIFESF